MELKEGSFRSRCCVLKRLKADANMLETLFIFRKEQKDGMYFKFYCKKLAIIEQRSKMFRKLC